MKRYFLKKASAFSNNILASIDKYFLAQTTKDFPPLFIVGVPRSGTTMVYQIITYQFKVAYFTPVMDYLYGIPNILFRLLKPYLKRPKPLFQSNYGKVKGLLSPSETGTIWYRWFPWDDLNSHFLRISENEIYDDCYQNLKLNILSISTVMQRPLAIKCVYLGMVINILSQLFPHARFIHVHRDSLITIQSLYIARKKQADSLKWWSVKPPQYNQIRQKPLLQQTVEQVYYTDKTIREELNESAKERTFHIDYEKICQTPHQTMQDLEDWLKPSGYERYKPLDLPDSFPLSNKYILDKEILSKMSDHLDKLRKMDSLN
jgi:hypothetical protein